jgi:hypothetical protein
MSKIQIFDPALCCSSGVCGTEVDQALVDFSAAMDAVKRAGGDIERFNLAQQPLEFAQNAVVKAFLDTTGVDGLPLMLVDGEIALAGRYPSRDELARMAGVNDVANDAAPVGCCSGKSCC